MPLINVADLKCPDDPQGRTYRQINAEKRHHIPVGTLVEIVSDEGDSGYSGVRLYVVGHGRDCDQTPLYWLGPDRFDTVKEREGFANRKWIGGFSDEGIEPVMR